MRQPHLSILLISILLSGLSLSVEENELKPCTVFNPSNGNYYDLNAITVQPLQNHKKAHKDDRTESWHARGYDYSTNFTLNFCSPVIEDLHDVVGVKENLWKNVSAYYTHNEKTYSIGQATSEPVFRGRKLVLNYTDGSPCDETSTRLPRALLGDHDDDKDKKKDEDNDDGQKDGRKPHSPSASKGHVRTKSTLISFLCDRDSLAPKAHISFIGASPDECAYFFEARSMAACGGVSEAQQTLGPAGVFGVIALIAAAVYLLGGIAYQRTVMHQRGWRQLPNYNLWAGIFGFVKDIFIILTSSCARFIPRRRGYNQLPTSGRARTREAEENGLIDSLDEEWDT